MRGNGELFKPFFWDKFAPFDLMKYLFLAFLALVLTAGFAPAQEPANEGLGLIPDTLEPVKKPKAEPIPKKSQTEQTGDDLQARIRYRDARTSAAQDAKVQAEWDRSRVAKTNPDKRDALASYYNALYARMLKIDPTLKERVVQEQAMLAWRIEKKGNPKKKSALADKNAGPGAVGKKKAAAAKKAEDEKPIEAPEPDTNPALVPDTDIPAVDR